MAKISTAKPIWDEIFRMKIGINKLQKHYEC